MLVNFAGPTYSGRSVNIDASRCVNWFPELSPDPNAKYPMCLVGTPGSTLSVNLGVGPIRGMYAFAGRMFVVQNSTLYAGLTVNTLLPVGGLITNTGYVSMSDNGLASNGLGGNQLMLVDGAAGYIFDVSTNVFTQVESIGAVQATATLTISTGTIDSVKLLTQGSGYTYAPTALVTGGGGSGATLQVNIGGRITAINLNATLAITGTPIVTITDTTGTGATAHAVFNFGFLNSIVVDTQGSGYSATPTVVVTNVPGVVATAVVDFTNPTILSITVTNPGSGYTSTPSVVFQRGNVATPDLLVSSISGTGVTATANFVNHGLTTGDTITAFGSTGAVTGTYNATNVVVTVLSTSQFQYPATGTGTPTLPPLVFRTALVNPPTALAVVSPTSITGIVVTNGGAGYISPPIVTITGSGPLPFVPTAITGTGSVVTGTSANHGMATGDIITATGSSTPGYNTVTPQIVTVTSSSTFTYSGTGIGTPTTFPTIIDTTLGTVTTTTTVVNSTITAITITSGGTGFTGTPSISISAPEGVSFPPNPTHVEYLDGYFIVVNNTLKFFVSELYNGLLWNALATGAVSAGNTPIQAVVASNQQLYFFCLNDTEIWSDSGTPTSIGSPFTGVTGAVIPFGTVSGFSVVRGSTGIFFLATQLTSNGSEFVGVYEMNGYTPQLVSPPNINYLISHMGDLSNSIAYTRIQEGHTFYVLSIPNGNSTLVYDSTTQMWHEWSWYSGSPYQINRHIGQVFVNFLGIEYVGSYVDGSIYALSTAVYTDAGQPIASVRTAPHLTDPQTRTRVFYESLLIDIDVGDGPIGLTPFANLAWSNDSGHTWSNDYPASLGDVGEYKTRVLWRRLGHTRDRVYRLMISDPIRKIIIGAYQGDGI